MFGENLETETDTGKQTLTHSQTDTHASRHIHRGIQSHTCINTGLINDIKNNR